MNALFRGTDLGVYRQLILLYSFFIVAEVAVSRHDESNDRKSSSSIFFYSFLIQLNYSTKESFFGFGIFIRFVAVRKT